MSMDGKRKKRRVCFQTSVDQSVEKSAMQTFVVFERGDSGDLTFNQFKKAVERLGMELKADQVRRLFGEVDEDGNGKVDFEEFLRLVKQRSKTTTQEEEERRE